MATVGIPRETKRDEYRIAITPDGVLELAHHGVSVVVERDAGAGSSVSNEALMHAGAEIVDDASTVWERADMVLKVKEPQPDEYRYLRDDLVLFTYLHLA